MVSNVNVLNKDETAATAWINSEEAMVPLKGYGIQVKSHGPPQGLGYTLKKHWPPAGARIYTEEALAPRRG